MSIFPNIPVDNTTTLYKQFVDNITGVRTTPVMDIPLANLFRLMEMYRYDAYYDGTHDNWHIPIVKGLDLAKVKVFGLFTQKTVCVDAIESSLRKVADKSALSEAERAQLNDFLNTFKEALQ